MRLSKASDLIYSVTGKGVPRKFGTSLDEIKRRFLSHLVNADNGCKIWTGSLNSRGYGRLSFGRKWRSVEAHRVSYVLFRGDIPGGLLVLHRCDNPPCCNPGHLFLGTNDQNIRDAVIKKRFPYGEQSFKAKLSDKDALTIRDLYAGGTVTHRELAERFGVVKSTIHCLLLRKTWRHI